VLLIDEGLVCRGVLGDSVLELGMLVVNHEGVVVEGHLTRLDAVELLMLAAIFIGAIGGATRPVKAGTESFLYGKLLNILCPVPAFARQPTPALRGDIEDLLVAAVGIVRRGPLAPVLGKQGVEGRHVGDAFAIIVQEGGLSFISATVFIEVANVEHLA
jgi:hypothetical protein